MLEQFQTSWDDLVKKHRLDLVTGVSEKTLENFVDLKLTNVSQDDLVKGIYQADFTKGENRFKFMLFINVKENYTRFNIRKDDENLISEIAYRFSMFAEEETISQEEKMKLKELINSIKEWMIKSGKIYKEHLNEQKIKRFQEKLIGKTIMEVNLDEAGEAYLVFEDNETMPAKEFFKECCEKGKI